MSDLRDDLASLRIDRTAPPATRAAGAIAMGAVVVALLAGLGGYLGLREVPTQVLAAPASVERGTASAEGSPLLTATGYVVARRKAVVSAKIQGRLAELKVEEGSRVSEGDVLARLESADLEAELARTRAGVRRAEADLAESRRQLEVATRLAGEQVVPTDTRDAAQSRVRVSEAALGQARSEVGFAQASLANTVIRAPFSGVVVRKMAEVGESVAPIPPGVNLSTSSGAIVALADLDTLEVESDVAESNVARLADRQPAQVTVEALPERTFRAELRQVLPTADRTKATVQVKVTILERDPSLKPEMSARVTFLERAPTTVAGGSGDAPAALVTVPKAAVIQKDGRAAVFTVRDGKARLVSVVTGVERKDRIVVKQGLGGSETVVLDPPPALRDGALVRVGS